jgi:predicted RND superfamily exporter protein
LTTGSILGAVGIWGYLGMPMSAATAIAPIVILTVAIANCVHIIATFRHGLVTGLEKDEALAESVRVNLQPVSLASLTTAVGFASLNFSDAPPFAHMGTIVAIGVIISLLLALSFLPAMMSVLPVRIPRKLQDSSGVMERIADFVIGRYRLLFMGISATIVIMSFGLTQLQIDDVFVNYLDQTMRFRIDSDFEAEHMGGNGAIDYSLRSGAEGGISEPDFLQDVSDLANWFQEQPEVVNVVVLTDTMRRLNKSMHGDNEADYVLPQSRELAAQYLLMYELSLPYGLDMNNQVDIGKSATRMTVTMKSLSSQEILALDQRAQEWAREHLAYVEPIEGTGPLMMIGKLGIRNVKSMMLGFAIAIFLISGVLVMAFGSVKYGLISLIPNLAPILMAFGIWGVYSGLLGMGLAGVASIGLGIVIDDTVHFMSKYLRAIRERGYTPPDAIRHAFRTVGHALWTTSLILVIGFLVISRSPFYLNYGIGLLTSWVVALALGCVFLYLPAVLLVMTKRERATQPA